MLMVFCLPRDFIDSLLMAQEAAQLLGQADVQRANEVKQAQNSSKEKDTQNNKDVSSKPLLEIKPADSSSSTYTIELRNVDLADFFRVVAQDCKLNILLDNDVKGNITASFNNITIEDAFEGIAELSGLSIGKNKNIIKISSNLISRVFVLKNIEAKKLLEPSSAQTQGVSSTTGTGSADNQASAGSSEGNTTQSTSSSSEGARQSNSIYDLLSERGKILHGQYPNSIMVIDYPVNVKKVEDYIQAVDQRMASRVFKLKYLRAVDISGAGSAQSTTNTMSGTSASGTTGSSATPGAGTQ